MQTESELHKAQAAIEGAVTVLEDMRETCTDPRLAAVIAALEQVDLTLEEATEDCQYEMITI